MKTMTETEYARLPEEYRGTRELDGAPMALYMDDDGATVYGTVTVLDDVDAAILARRAAALESPEPNVGDWLRFADGRVERIAHVWPAGWHDDNVARVQPTVPKFGWGSIYLGEGYTSYSGALDTGIRVDRLKLAALRRPGRVWFFHHDYARAHNGVDVEIPFKVYDVAEAVV